MHQLFFLGIFLTWGWICSRIAKKRGYNSRFWFVMGFLFGLFSLSALFLMRKKNVETTPITTKEPTIEIPQTTTLWYYLDKNHTQQGPISGVYLQELFQKNVLDMETYLWNEDMEEWKKYKEIFRPE